MSSMKLFSSLLKEKFWSLILKVERVSPTGIWFDQRGAWYLKALPPIILLETQGTTSRSAVWDKSSVGKMERWGPIRDPWPLQGEPCLSTKESWDRLQQTPKTLKRPFNPDDRFPRLWRTKWGVENGWMNLFSLKRSWNNNMRIQKFDLIASMVIWT